MRCLYSFSAQQQQRQSRTAKTVHIAIVATVKFSDLAVNPLRRSAGTTRKCGSGCDFFCPKRNEKTNKNLHPLLPKSTPNNNNNSSINNIRYNKLSRSRLYNFVNYRFLTTETNLKALYIYFVVFLTQPHQ